MSKYERQKVEVSSLQDGDTFELLRRESGRCDLPVLVAILYVVSALYLITEGRP